LHTSAFSQSCCFRTENIYLGAAKNGVRISYVPQDAVIRTVALDQSAEKHAPMALQSVDCLNGILLTLLFEEKHSSQQAAGPTSSN